MFDIITTIVLGSVKFGMTFPLAIMEFQFSYFETILWINVGGILGIFFFAYLSEGLNKWINHIIQRRKNRRKDASLKTKSKKIFTKRNRKIIKIKQRYGLAGIAISTPIIFSIPIGVFLIVRYYPKVRTRFLYLITANLVWSFIYTSFYMFWNDLLFVR
ncbi:hypothetical protein ACFLT1_08935 [Bacteroidota bacterium]